MAQIGSVNAVFTASVGGLTAGISAAGKAFKTLGGDSATLRSAMASLQGITTKDFLNVSPVAQKARAAFLEIGSAIQKLRADYAAGAESSYEFADSMNLLTQQAATTAKAFQTAAAITAEFQTAGQEYAARMGEIADAVALAGLKEDVAAKAREAALQTLIAETAAANNAASAINGLAGALDGVGTENPFAGIADAFTADAAGLVDTLVASFEEMNNASSGTAAALAQTAAAEAERQAVFARGAEVTKSVATPMQDYIAAIGELDALQKAGAITGETYAAAMAMQGEILRNADGSAAAAAAAAAQLQAVQAQGAAVARSVATAEEQHAAKLAELNTLLKAGAISQQTFDRAVAQSAAGMKSAGTAAKTMESGISGITSRLNVLIALDVTRFFSSIVSTVSSSVSSLIRMGQAEAGVIDQTSKLADRLGVTYGEMAGLSLAAQKSGVSMDSMKAAMTKADVAFVRAAQGSKEASAAFQGLGLSVEDLNGMNTADRFQAIAKAIAQLPTEAERAAAATQVFGRAGADLLPMFEGGAEGIARATEEANKFGTALSTAQGRDVTKMVSSFETAQVAISGVVQQVTAYLSPAITGVVNQFNEFIANVGGANIGEAIGDGILTGAEYLASIGDYLITNFSSTFQYFSKVGEQLGSVFSFLNRTVSFLSGVWNVAKGIFLTIVGSFSGVFQGLATIAQKIGYYLGFDTGSIDKLVAGAAAFNAEINKGITDAANGAARDFGNAFATEAKPLGKEVAGPLQSALQGFRAAARESKNAVEDVKKKPLEIKQTVEVQGIAQALKAVDSRSQAGVAEYFRLMRGDTGNVQEKQLSVLEEIRDGIAGQEDMPPFGLTGG